MRKVSQMVGVSTATVSRALKNPEMVLPETRDKVLKAVEALGYRPNILAKNFSSGKTQTVVVIVTDLTNPFFSRIVQGVEEEAQKLGYSVLLGDTNDDINRERVYAEMVLNNRADGLIQLDHLFPFADKDKEIAKTVPMVSVCDAIDGDYAYPYITIDNFAASRDVAKHLISLGHTKIGAIAGRDDSHVTSDRLGGLMRVMQEHSIPFNQDWFMRGGYTKQCGKESMEKLLALADRPTAVYCFSDEIAIGAIKAIKNHGLRIPEDISIVGFDNVDICEYMDPSLTTVDQPAVDMGRRAMQILFQLINGEPIQSITEYKPYTLLVRDSTGPVPN
ncbi:LacI family DNA-binding transcriptional regulator [Agaribacter flavus]|uniref:LacI family DNA-binding transcriptional regulator n=2 Tax=Agaribacter flavus TaxID=1902781 RepID=A0ABV7FJX8_9ALTE